MKKDKQKKRQIQEIGGYDDSTARNLNRLDIIEGLNLGVEAISNGIKKLIEFRDSILEEEKLKAEITPLISNIVENIEKDLEQLLKTISDYYGENLANLEKYDVFSYNMKKDMPGNRGISLNEEKEETLFEWKVNQSINRINKIMDKIK